MRRLVDHLFSKALAGMEYQDRMKFYALCNCFFTSAICVVYVTIFHAIKSGFSLPTVIFLLTIGSSVLSVHMLRRTGSIRTFIGWNLINGYCVAVLHNIVWGGFISTGGTYVWAVIIIIVSIIYYDDKVARIFFLVYIGGFVALLLYELFFQQNAPSTSMAEQLGFFAINLLGLGMLIYSTFSIFVKDLIRNLNEANSEAQRLAKVKGDFLSQMSHEIRTPLNAIIGMTQVAQMRGSNAENIEETLGKIEANSRHLLGVINDILDYSKMDASQLVLDHTQFDLAQTIEFLISMFNAQALAKGIHFTTDVSSIVHRLITTDALRLNQVLINFLSNAIKFTPEGGTVHLHINETAHQGGCSTLAFSVSDTGIGMSKEDIDRLFTPFMQANTSITRTFGGTGLGLAISANIVRLMGSHISVLSAVGKGTTFSFALSVPACKAPDEQPIPAELTEVLPQLAGKRLLLVDDVPINREIIVAMLEDSGVLIEEAQDGKEALSMFTQSPLGYYDLILMDVQMPVMDGLTATARIRDSGREDAHTVKIVALTANVIKEDVDRMFEAGMDAHLAKPVEYSALMDSLQTHLLDDTVLQ